MRGDGKAPAPAIGRRGRRESDSRNGRRNAVKAKSEQRGWLGFAFRSGLVAVALVALVALALAGTGEQIVSAAHGNSSVAVESDWFCDAAYEGAVFTATIDQGDAITWGGWHHQRLRRLRRGRGVERQPLGH